jgi:DNA-binding NarL/FixJ family response regulator
MQTLRLLLNEPSALMRQTVALTAGSVGVGPVFQAATARAAQELLQQHVFGAVILSLDPGPDDIGDAGHDAMRLLEMLRAGQTQSPRDLGVVVTASACSRAQVDALMTLGVDRVLLKPFKARLLIEALTELSQRTTESA